MRSVLLSSLLLCSANLYAQEQQLPQRSSEIGLMVDFNLTGNYTGPTSLAGVQYKHFGKKNIGYRVFAGFGSVQNSDYYNSYSSAGDTSIERRSSMQVSMPMVGGGIEGQHPLYKHVYMYAAMELRAGYGSGHIDTVDTRPFPSAAGQQPGVYTEAADVSRGPKANMFFLGFTPAVGIKFQFSRIAFGTELSNPVCYTGSNQLPGSQFDFDMGRINQRVFLHYRF